VRKLRRTIVELDREIYRVLKLRAASTGQTISEIVNGSLRLLLVEDAIDLEAFELREDEPALAFRAVARDLVRRGRL
jgi:hypothetical protein